MAKHNYSDSKVPYSSSYVSYNGVPTTGSSILLARVICLRTSATSLVARTTVRGEAATGFVCRITVLRQSSIVLGSSVTVLLKASTSLVSVVTVRRLGLRDLTCSVSVNYAQGSAPLASRVIVRRVSTRDLISRLHVAPNIENVFLLSSAVYDYVDCLSFARPQFICFSLVKS